MGRQMTLKELRVNLRNSYLAELSLFRLVNSDLFYIIYNKIDDEERKQIISTIDNRAKKSLNKLMNKLIMKYNLLELMQITELRRYGRELGILNYSIHTKDKLISLIYEKQNN